MECPNWRLNQAAGTRWKNRDGFGELFTSWIGKLPLCVEMLLILNRHMNIGNPSRSLALAETGRKEYLPVEGRMWELGVSLQSSESAPQLLFMQEVIASEPLLVSSSTNIAAAPFTRLCQASHLLSPVLHMSMTISSSHSLGWEKHSS
ncbi:hypothetical protein F5882DRAFT_348345 [Hyaloscypha sp. PMI_1271]|nr:hypothetical protein F5882DRAFT_348345 [Hyaloscypha sp. PMI_1271]